MHLRTHGGGVPGPTPLTTSCDRGSMKTRWLRVHAPRADAQHRLFCFPHAGGGGSAYRLWPAGLPKHVEVVTIELPGRESRFGEPPTTRLATIVDEVVEAASPLIRQNNGRP